MRSREAIPEPGSDNDSRIRYSDRLVTITDTGIVFHHYSFPFFTSDRRVPFPEIDRIDVKRPTILTGKWRIGGSGNLRTWFPFDAHRQSRDWIFHATLKNGGWEIGFTVEDPVKVTGILKEKGVRIAEEVIE